MSHDMNEWAEDTPYLTRLADVIKNKRQIKDSSVKVYVFNIQKLHHKIFGNREVTSLEFLKDYKMVIHTLSEDMKPSSIKTYLASIVVALTAENDEDTATFYREDMIKLANQHAENEAKQEKTETQLKNWVSLKELRTVVRNYKAQLKNVFTKNPDQITPKERDLLQMWLVGSLYTGDSNPPTRNDYIMKILTNKAYIALPDEDKNSHNYLVIKNKSTKFFSFGNYKTAGTYGVKEIPVGKTLNATINVYRKFNTSDDLLLNANKSPMTSNGLTKYLNKVFSPTGKQISSTMIRHIYISTKFPAQTAEKTDIADKMLHSVSQQTEYAKK